MLVSSISPAPSSLARQAHSMASMPVSMRPPFLKMFHPDPSGRLFASIATTTHWLPNLSAASEISSGRLMAAELTATLSAPSLRISLKSSTARIPPPTVNGMKTRSATRRTMSTTVFRASDVAVMSRNTSSSAPSASYAAAASTGSPASFKLTK